MIILHVAETVFYRPCFALQFRNHQPQSEHEQTAHDVDFI